MNKLKSYLPIVTIILLVIVLIAVLVGGNQPTAMGGNTRFPNSDLSARSYRVSNTEVIDSTGAFTGTVSGTINTSNTLTVSGASDVSTLTQGGGVRATSTLNSAETLLASDFDVENYIEYTPNISSVTLTLPATSTLATMIPNAGDTRTIIIENATSTASIDITISAGAGMDLQEPDGQDLVISEDNYAILTFWRRSDTDMVVTVDVFIPAD
jgi:hypothetical protein